MTFTETLKTEYVFLVPNVETIISAINLKKSVYNLFKADFVSNSDIKNGVEGYTIERVQAFALKSFSFAIKEALLVLISDFSKQTKLYDFAILGELEIEKSYFRKRALAIHKDLNDGSIYEHVTMNIHKKNIEFS